MDQDLEQEKELENIQTGLEQIKRSYQEIIKLNEQLKAKNEALVEQQAILHNAQQEIGEHVGSNNVKFKIQQKHLVNIKNQSKITKQEIAKDWDNLISSDFSKLKQELGKIIHNFQRNIFTNLIKNSNSSLNNNGQGNLLNNLFANQHIDKSLFGITNGGNNLMNFFSKLLPQARAIGGMVEPRKPYLVGEYGPEIFVPSNSGHINSKQPKKNNIAINLTINTPNVDSFKKSQQQIINEIANNLKI